MRATGPRVSFVDTSGWDPSHHTVTLGDRGVTVRPSVANDADRFAWWLQRLNDAAHDGTQLAVLRCACCDRGRDRGNRRLGRVLRTRVGLVMEHEVPPRHLLDDVATVRQLAQERDLPAPGHVRAPRQLAWLPLTGPHAGSVFAQSWPVGAHCARHGWLPVDASWLVRQVGRFRRVTVACMLTGET